MMFGSSSIMAIMKVLLMIVLSTCAMPLDNQTFNNIQTNLILLTERMDDYETQINQSSIAMPLVMKHPCKLYRVEYVRIFNKTKENGDEEESNWVCELDAEDRTAFNSYFSVKVEGLDDMALCNDGRKSRSNSCVVSGQTLLYSPYAEIKQKTIKFHSQHPPVLEAPPDHGKRRLATTTGNRTAVVLRVIPTDTTPYTAAELYNRVFNTSKYSLRTGYHDCSYGQLVLRPTNHSKAVNGVVNVNINMIATGKTVDDVMNAALTKATTLLGDLSSQFDHVLLVMPPGVVNSDGGLFGNAFAYLNSYLSVFSMNLFTVSGLMHEIGHNLNLGHSGEGSVEYDDQTCLMGYSYGETYYPKMCFNGAKSFNLGWYSSRTKTLDILTSNTSNFTEQYTLIGVADYQNPNNNASSLVVLKLEAGSKDYYISFNRKIGINSENQEYGDYVMVVAQDDDPSESWIMTKFNTVGDYIIANVGGSTFDIIISVSAINLSSNPAKATVSINRVLSRGFGPIRSYLGFCIDIWGQNGIVNGNYGFIWDCDGTNTQLWFKPSLSDNRLQVYNTDLCLDLEDGNVNTGSDYVLLRTCDDTKASQQWEYDGPHIRLKYNTGLCLKIEGTSIERGSWLIVGPCDNELGTSWVEYSKSMAVGNPGNSYSHLLCPVGSRVINISGRAGWWMDQLVMICSDGTVLGPVGGGGGSAFTSVSCMSGYSSVTMKQSSGHVGMLESFCRGSSSSTVGTNGDSPVSVTFYVTEEIIGMDVYSGSYVDGLALLYWSRPESIKKPTSRPRKPTSKPFRSPSKKPSRRPTKKPSRRPSKKPSRRPSKKPSRRPSRKPSRRPSRKPSRRPSKKPSRRPSRKPSRRPSRKPSRRPSRKPSRRPSRRPTSRGR